MRLRLETDKFISVNDYKKIRVVNGIPTPFKTQKTKDFEKLFDRHIREEIQKQGWAMPGSEYFVRVDATFVFPRTNCDSNNYWKSMLDVCTRAGVWIDDSRVKENVKKIMYNSKDPKIILDIYIDKQIGLFDCEEEYREFRDRCKTCKRYSRNCSILNGAMSSKIGEGLYLNTEVDKWICTKYKD